MSPVDTPGPRPEGAPPAAVALDEGDLVRRCQAGETRAFEPLVEKYRERVWRLAFQVLHDREEAWDCAQEAFVRAYQSIGAFRGQSAFYTWLFRIAMNVATDRHRARAARGRAFGTEEVPPEEWERTAPDPAAPPDQIAAQAEQRARIERALDALPPKARAIIMLSDIEGLSYREIADVLNCPIGTVMSRLHNARKRLRAVLGPMLALLLALLGLAPLAAPSPAGAESPPTLIRFGVRVLQATNATPGAGAAGTAGPGAAPPVERADPGHEPDERLRRILPHLRTLFRYSEYTTLDRRRVDGALGAQQRFPIPGERWLEVTPDELHGNSVRMRVRLLRGGLQEMNTGILAGPGQPAILGGPRYNDGVLIIILWANPNPR
ncbi:MAG: sigma-70 family RNA polymerase sigma factor [Candidatus Rokubacteria bacterium]|nr:sigma-70 family RNA polymerase sigma factor [Candidatus Rokubacteria bacterium]